MGGLDFSKAKRRLGASMELVSHLAEAIRQGHLEEAAANVRCITQEETEAYKALSEMLGVS